MNMDNIYSVLPGEGGDDEEDALRHPETPSQPTRQGLAGERSPNVRALAAARAAAARRTRLRQEGVMAPEETLGTAADGTHSGDAAVDGPFGGCPGHWTNITIPAHNMVTFRGETNQGGD